MGQKTGVDFAGELLVTQAECQGVGGQLVEGLGGCDAAHVVGSLGEAGDDGVPDVWRSFLEDVTQPLGVGCLFVATREEVHGDADGTGDEEDIGQPADESNRQVWSLHRVEPFGQC